MKNMVDPLGVKPTNYRTMNYDVYAFLLLHIRHMYCLMYFAHIDVIFIYFL